MYAIMYSYTHKSPICACREVVSQVRSKTTHAGSRLRQATQLRDYLRSCALLYGRQVGRQKHSLPMRGRRGEELYTLVRLISVLGGIDTRANANVYTHEICLILFFFFFFWCHLLNLLDWFFFSSLFMLIDCALLCSLKLCRVRCNANKKRREIRNVIAKTFRGYIFSMYVRRAYTDMEVKIRTTECCHRLGWLINNYACSFDAALSLASTFFLRYLTSH